MTSGTAFAVPIMVDTGSSPLGFYFCTISFDPSVVQITSVTGEGVIGLAGANTNNPGLVIMLGLNGFSLTQPTGLVAVAELGFAAVGPPGSSTTLAFVDAPAGPVAIGDTDGTPLPAIATDGAVHIVAAGIDELVPCAGPASGGTWRSHGEYIAAVVNVGRQLLSDGTITQAQLVAIVQKAAQSGCGARAK